MKRLSLFGKYWAWLAMLVTLPIMFAAAVVGESVYRRSYDAVLERQALEARQAAYLIERWVLPPIERLQLVAKVPWNQPSATRDEFVAEIRRLTRQFGDITRVQRVDPTGQVVDFVAQDGRPRTLEDTERRDLDGFLSDSDRKPMVLLRRVRNAENPQPDWSVGFRESGTAYTQIADFGMGIVNKAFAGLLDPGGNRVFVVDGRGTILAPLDVSLVHNVAALADLRGWSAIPNLTNVLEGKTSSEGSFGEVRVQVSVDPAVGDEWFGAYRRIDKLGWTVFALTPSKGLRAEMRSNVLRTASVLLGANVVALLLAWLLAHRMSKPLASLADASQRVAQGDLSASAQVLGDDEISRLARQFNAMVDQLRESYGRLEERVAEKTAELERANRHKSEFLAQMSHELRTPLNAVIGFSDALLARYFGPLTDKQTEYVRDIRRSGHHLLTLINDLLDLAKIEAGRMDLSWEPVDVASVVEASAALVRQRAYQKELTLETFIDPSVSACIADGRRLKQVLVNLLSNAVKFTPPGGKVDIRVERVLPPAAGDTCASSADDPSAAMAATNAVEDVLRPQRTSTGGVRFSVSDTGIGIPRDQLATLFTDFGQLRHPADPAREGTGLGLALSQRIVNLHGSSIDVETEVGRGSTFRFTLIDRVWPTS